MFKQKLLDKVIKWDSVKKSFVVAPIFLSFVIFLFIIILVPVLNRVWASYHFPFLDRSVIFNNPKDIIINLTPLRNKLNAIAGEIGNNNISLYLEVLNSGANVAINKDLRMFPVSLAKLPLAIVVMKKVENHKLALGDLIEIGEEDQDSRSGEMYKLTPGTKVSVEYLIKELLIDSDNTAQHVLLRNINQDDMQSLIDETGLEDLADPTGRISAKEYARFYRTLFFSSYLTPGDSQKILKLLSQSTFKEFLSAGIPEGVTFSHKYGLDVDSKIYLDSGIIYISNQPVMITAMLRGMNEDQAHEYMATIAKEAFDYISNYQKDGQ